jgi:hypothetical protein
LAAPSYSPTPGEDTHDAPLRPSASLAADLLPASDEDRRHRHYAPDRHGSLVALRSSGDERDRDMSVPPFSGRNRTVRYSPTDEISLQDLSRL